MSGAVFKDEAQVTDSVSASIETEVKAAVVPCPECNGETKQHGHPERTGVGIRVCSSATCRAESEDVKEEKSAALLARGAPRFPCTNIIDFKDRSTDKTKKQPCGKETKVKASAPKPALGRICANPECRHEFELS